MRKLRLVAALAGFALAGGCLLDSAPDEAPGGHVDSNRPPVASAGPDVTVIDADGDGEEHVVLDGSASHDPDGDIAEYVWTEGDAVVGTGARPSVLLGAGSHEITLTVTDDRRADGLDALVITVRAAPGERPAPPPDFRVAFTADMGHGPDTRRVLELVRDEGAQALLVAGDLSYSGVSLWTDLVTEVLGASFPVFATVGNHDTADWPAYQAFLQERADLVGATWYGDYGIQSTVLYGNVVFVLLGAGTLGDVASQEEYLSAELSAYSHVWEIACWHKNMNAMQVGSKSDDTGWGVYETARLAGALIMTGHEHSYERTQVLGDMVHQGVVDATSPYVIRPGQTYVTVSGLGGRSIRNQDRCLPTTYPYGCNGMWGKIYTSDQGAKFGALFVDFHVDGNPHKGRGYFKNVDGDVVDSYEILKRD